MSAVRRMLCVQPSHHWPGHKHVDPDQQVLEQCANDSGMAAPGTEGYPQGAAHLRDGGALALSIKAPAVVRAQQRSITLHSALCISTMPVAVRRCISSDDELMLVTSWARSPGKH
jgi:hypothetical protein